MPGFAEIATHTGIKEWWFEVATNIRPLLTPSVTSLEELRNLAYQAPDDSEEKFAGYVHWVKSLDDRATNIQSLDDALFILRHAPPWHTMAAFRANHAKNTFEANKHPRAHRREYLDEQGTIAYFIRQLELVENYEECFELYSYAQHRCVVVNESIFEKMLTFAATWEELKEIHDLSLCWYSTKLSSLRQMVELFSKTQPLA